MSFGFVQGKNTKASSSTSATLTLPGVSAGNVLRVLWFIQPNTLTLSSMTAGGAAMNLIGTGGSDAEAVFGCAWISGASGSVGVTATASASASGIVLLAEEWSGGATTGAVDGYSYGSGYVTSQGSGSFTPAQNGDDIWTACYVNDNSNALTTPGGYTLRTSNSNPNVSSADLVQATAGAVNPTWSTTVATWLVVAGVAFKAGGVAPVTCKPSLALLGVGCGIALARRNPLLPRRRLIVPPGFERGAE